MNTSLKIALAQLNFKVGDIDGNSEKIIFSAIKARDELKADLIVFPELAVCGYPPEDLLLIPSFYQEINEALHKIKSHVKEDLIQQLGFEMVTWL